MGRGEREEEDTRVWRGERGGGKRRSGNTRPSHVDGRGNRREDRGMPVDGKWGIYHCAWMRQFMEDKGVCPWREGCKGRKIERRDGMRGTRNGDAECITIIVLIG